MTIKARDRDALIQSLRAGVVPRIGQHLIQVGRVREIEAMIRDVERIAEGGSAFRVVSGDYGSGKTFFLNLVRSIGMEKKLVTASADLTPDRRLHATGGQARSLYAELMKNLSTRTKADGGALPGVVEKFVTTAMQEAEAAGEATEVVIRRKLDCLSEMVNGYDFATVIACYYRGHESGNEQLKSDAIRWLRGEFTTKTDARNALGVRTIVDDASFYDQLKLMARFVRLAGFAGLLVCLDELVNLYKMSQTQARKSNYEQILRILNDTLQGSAEGLGVLLGVTPETLSDRVRGLYSYEALQSRLAANAFAKDGLVDYSHPVLSLANLSPEDFYVLLTKIRDVFAYGDPTKHLLPDTAVPAFMEHCAERIGDSYFRTPRNTVTAFVNLLAVLEQNPQANWQELLGKVEISRDLGAASDLAVDIPGASTQTQDEFANFSL
jgi:hypothetical protein